MWWLLLGLGVGILALGLLSTGRWACDTAARAATLFEQVDRVANTGVAPLDRATPTVRAVEHTALRGSTSGRPASSSAGSPNSLTDSPDAESQLP